MLPAVICKGFYPGFRTNQQRLLINPSLQTLLETASVRTQHKREVKQVRGGGRWSFESQRFSPVDDRQERCFLVVRCLGGLRMYKNALPDPSPSSTVLTAVGSPECSVPLRSSREHPSLTVLGEKGRPPELTSPPGSAPFTAA